MLIDFSVANFRSFRNTQTLSMVAAPRLGRRQNIFHAEVEEETLPALLKVAVIYGPNASGKSNLVRALAALRTIATLQPSATAHTLPVSPFRFDPKLAARPSEFTVNFIAQKRRFRFELAATKERIVREQLVIFPGGHEHVLYKRVYEGGVERYSLGSHLEGGGLLHETWQGLTGPQRLFLAQAVANSSAQLQQLRAPFGWLQSNLLMLPAELPMSGLARMTQLLNQTGRYQFLKTEHIASFIRDLDIPVTDLKFEAPEDGADVDVPRAVDETAYGQEPPVKATLTHRSALGDARFEFDEESGGTQNLIGFFLLWSFLRNQDGPQLLSIDELDSSLHPQILASLVRKHIQMEPPKQLIFTTHDTHLMDTRMLRRDQIWLTERDRYGATQLRAIHDFEGRESEDVEKRYYEGRYRGLPILREG